MSGLRTIFASAAMVVTIASGFAMWSAISPGDERNRKLLKSLPESNPRRMEESREKNVLLLQALKEAAETDDNIARR